MSTLQAGIPEISAAVVPTRLKRLRHFAANHVLLVVGLALLAVIVSSALFAPSTGVSSKRYSIGIR